MAREALEAPEKMEPSVRSLLDISECTPAPLQFKINVLKQNHQLFMLYIKLYQKGKVFGGKNYPSSCQKLQWCLIRVRKENQKRSNKDASVLQQELRSCWIFLFCFRELSYNKCSFSFPADQQTLAHGY